MRSQDEERRRIARNLHDSLGQYLAGIKMSVESGCFRPKLRWFRRKVHTEDIIREVKRHSYYLKPCERRRYEGGFSPEENSQRARQGLS